MKGRKHRRSDDAPSSSSPFFFDEKCHDIWLAATSIPLEVMTLSQQSFAYEFLGSGPSTASIPIKVLQVSNEEVLQRVLLLHLIVVDMGLKCCSLMLDMVVLGCS
ncbi:hypothetical protein MRB53_011092 [Persea americana]|uniref:Uncharacterized protein n=1 Tax=Persea americana TaxID=3435 RepID=A0ACC2LTT1_PERAE|nr:hypothetical protein MRB53_011092 [Persea americana]